MNNVPTRKKDNMKMARYVLALAAVVLAWFGSGFAQTVKSTKVLDNGPDGQKLVFAVVGDGYAAGDQTKYVDDVNSLVINGVLAHDFFKDNINAFNVHRIDLVSKDSGVSKPGTSKDTSLKTVYTGEWKRCWIEESPSTSALLNAALDIIPKYDYVLIVQNETGFGGCRRGNRLYVTGGIEWDVVAHEYGHGIGGLFDEYTHPSKPFYNGIEYGPIVNVRNCSTVLNIGTVVWSSMLASPSLINPLPTVFNTSSMDSSQTVGIFEGCGTFQKGIYRPVENCRMTGNTPLFCPVCRAIMNRAVERYLISSPLSRNPSIGSQTSWLLPLPGQFGSIATYGVAWQNTSLQPDNSYLHVVMRVRRNASAEVIKITEVQGTLPPTVDAASSTLLVINDNNQPTAAEFLPEDPFTIRGFEDPNDRKGEFYAQGESATITVDLPKTSMGDAAAGTVSLELNQVKEAAKGNIILTQNDTALLQQLRSSGRLKLQVKLNEGRFKDAAKDRNKIRSIQ